MHLVKREIDKHRDHPPFSAHPRDSRTVAKAIPIASRMDLTTRTGDWWTPKEAYFVGDLMKRDQ